MTPRRFLAWIFYDRGYFGYSQLRTGWIALSYLFVVSCLIIALYGGIYALNVKSCKETAAIYDVSHRISIWTECHFRDPQTERWLPHEQYIGTRVELTTPTKEANHVQ